MTYSGLLMIVIGVSVARVLFDVSDRMWALMVLPALAVAVAVTFTRGAAVGACAAVALLFTLKDFRLLAILPIVAAVFIVMAPGQIAKRYASMFNMNDPTVVDRVTMLHIGQRMIRAHPLAGVGPNMVQRRYVEYRGSDALAGPDGVVHVNPHLHNNALQIAAERGLPALALWLWFIVAVGRDLGRRFASGSQRFLAAAALATLVALLTAGLFAHNIVALGGRVSLVGIVGADAAAVRLSELLAAVGVESGGLVEDRRRPTTEKVRVVTERNQQVARIDYERDADADGDVERAIVDCAARLARDAKALLVSDYLKGAIT